VRPPAEPPYERCLAVENIEPTRTKATSPQTNGICERFNKTILAEFYQVALRKKLDHAIEELQTGLEAWMRHDNTERTHQGCWGDGKTPMQTGVDRLPVAKETLSQAA
jgi:transposase InsO family protein